MFCVCLKETTVRSAAAESVPHDDGAAGVFAQQSLAAAGAGLLPVPELDGVAFSFLATRRDLPVRRGRELPEHDRILNPNLGMITHAMNGGTES